MAMNPAERRYTRSVLSLSIVYALTLFGTVAFFHGRAGVADPAAYLIAALPALPIVGIFATLGRYLIEERDEYLRMLVARQALIATALTLSCATVWGFVEDAGLARHVPAFYAAVLWFAGLGVGGCVNRLVERTRA